jgi:uncharacterized phage infection (PIP) family protein YhgE
MTSLIVNKKSKYGSVATHSVIDSNFMDYINSLHCGANDLHCRADNLKNDFNHIQKKVV